MCRVLIIVSFDGDVKSDAFNEDVTSYYGVSSERKLTMTVPNNRDKQKSRGGKRDEKRDSIFAPRQMIRDPFDLLDW